MSVDYMQKYLKPEGFDLPGLLNDDFFVPVKLLWNHEHYVSAMKLLMNFIDTVGFLEFGDSRENTFCKWLLVYADLTPLGVTEEELWEQRNSLLHMSNLDSRKVLAGRVKRLVHYVGPLPPGMPSEDEEAKYYNLWMLIESIFKACERWIESFKTERAKFDALFARYDLVVSDARMLRVELDRPERPPS